MARNSRGPRKNRRGSENLKPQASSLEPSLEPRAASLKPNPEPQASGLSSEELKHLYSLMVKVRLFNERATILQRQGRLHSFLGCVGQEAAILGSAYALESRDWIFPTYREHAIPLLRGVTLKELFDHLIANAADHIKGRNLPPEYSFRHIRFVSISAPVGSQLPQAVGAALAARIKGDDMVVMVYSGDGATSEGDFHVALNFAGVFQVPVVIFVQNNGWAISVPSSLQTASESFAMKAAAYGFEGELVDGNNLPAVYEVTRRAVAKARRGNGPTLIEARTYRLGPHSTSDDPRAYRDKAEVEEWEKKDPLLRFEQCLREVGCWSDAFGEETRTRAGEEVLAAAQAALKEPLPALRTLFEDVCDEMPWHLREQAEAYLNLMKNSAPPKRQAT